MLDPSDRLLLPWIIPVVDVLISAAASAHVLLTKKDSRAAVGWIGLIWLSPIIGTVIYVLFGINRISRKARSLRRDQPRSEPLPIAPCTPELMWETLGHAAEHLDPLARLVGRVTGRPLLAGNTVEPLRGGDEAYPAMLAAIEAAQGSVALATYIFNDDAVGRRFVAALAGARERGVAVRVLIDDVGARYDWPTVFRRLRREGIPAASFMPTLWAPTYLPYWNLRNHRKILVVDGRVGFTGGMNIDKDFFLRDQPRSPKHDLHFAMRGPVVADLMRAFADDWVFSTDELLGGDTWFPPVEPDGPTLARGVPAGPDERDNSVRRTILGALGCARKSVMIVTPYFVPDAAVLAAMEVASMSGVTVDIILPEQNNLGTVAWASEALFDQIHGGGARLWYTPPPFDHSKLMLVDGAWSFLGSANWDARSLRLNFEFNVECYGRELGGELGAIVQEKLAVAQPVTAELIASWSLPRRLRNAAAALMIPYL
jgi:cardiolipin synthase